MLKILTTKKFQALQDRLKELEAEKLEFINAMKLLNDDIIKLFGKLEEEENKTWITKLKERISYGTNTRR